MLVKGVSYFGRNISLKIAKIGDERPKFGVSVSKKEVKTAVKRNLLKRRVLSILREIEPKINSGFICLFFLKKGALDISYQQLQDEITFLLKKAKIL
jgi:ribonuclease P protein component